MQSKKKIEQTGITALYLELPSLARRHNYREETRKGVAVEYVPNALPA